MFEDRDSCEPGVRERPLSGPPCERQVSGHAIEMQMARSRPKVVGRLCEIGAAKRTVKRLWLKINMNVRRRR